ncbi:hypothetical protein N7489_009223 [Penicillium chrysogenum]|jgi:hypothetical protein|uniref:Uncharacterized protein n=1 Tax=Penicillium chrysogenum TaxID=5076 RepID=A0ABQ8WXZ3_PENCH|nr:uncharacterized protein N7489_009223 [Penicillium chrysogenum]XP_061069723.1 uncharacterized protein N7525_003424 [Penicillium rubens]KAJ5228515.1 hypothetical protein N7489_009223 [Penicillium chrysogenum]KAJ5257913.1 hypothetical protein N7524_009469 [Penicillium chrysogenum]KAJ5283854.1 hypothetical protein N7505_001834 [Penicillium chrysogenum]KAJ5838236.1 hypothetical protein N7525_003424 [Penicillium rubens]KAJ5866284.1 hypothetical protein N7534_000837 [Penicillium rubens]
MSSPGGSTAQAYIIYASVSLTGRPLVEVLLRRPTICSFPNATTNDRFLHPRASDLTLEPCLWDISSV